MLLQNRRVLTISDRVIYMFPVRFFGTDLESSAPVSFTSPSEAAPRVQDLNVFHERRFSNMFNVKLELALVLLCNVVTVPFLVLWIVFHELGSNSGRQRTVVGG